MRVRISFVAPAAMKRMLVWGMILLAIGQAGCAGAGTGRLLDHELPAITLLDARKIHPFSDLSERHISLTAEQAQAINRFYGRIIAAEGERNVYYEARRRRGIYGQWGNIFLVNAEGELGRLEVLISTAGGEVDEILIKNNPVLNGKPVIPREFLRQFIGRSLRDSWELAQDPSDLVALPSPIRPIASYPQFSQEVADAVRKPLVWTEVLEIQ